MSEEPPYGVIWDQIEAGEVIPFLGAGASLCGRPNDRAGHPLEWKGADPAFLPSGVELGQWLAAKCRYPDSTATGDLAKIASYYEIRACRLLLRRELRTIFARDYSFGPVHAFLAEASRPLLIVTTNYDNLIEKAFRAKGRAFHLVTHPERGEYAGSVIWWKPNAEEPERYEANKLPLSLTDTSIIYKMHGSVGRGAAGDSFVITEEDYVRFLARMTQKQAIPKRFLMHFEHSSFLFLGYGLGDWSLRVMLENLRCAGNQDIVSGPDPVGDQSDVGQEDPLGDLLRHIDTEGSELPSWAIQYDPSALERTLWTHRKIQIFDMGLDDFVTRMRAGRPCGADTPGAQWSLGSDGA